MTNDDAHESERTQSDVEHSDEEIEASHRSPPASEVSSALTDEITASPNSPVSEEAAATFEAEAASSRSASRNAVDGDGVGLKHGKDRSELTSVGNVPQQSDAVHGDNSCLVDEHQDGMVNAVPATEATPAIETNSNQPKIVEAQTAEPTRSDHNKWLLTQALRTVADGRYVPAFKNGNVAVILDPSDLYTIRLMPSTILSNLSDVFKDLVNGTAGDVLGSSPLDLADGPDTEIRYLLVLEQAKQRNAVPKLVRKPLDYIMDTDGRENEDERHKKCPSPKTSSEVKRIKREASPNARHNEKKKQRPNYIAAYDSLFRILTNKPQHRLPKDNIDKSLPQIEALVNVAGLYDCIPAVKSQLDSLFFHFIKGEQFWSSIQNDAARWVLLAVKLQDAGLYKEAMTHIIGRFPRWPWSVSQQEVPAEVMLTVQRKVWELKYLRQDIDHALIQNTLKIDGKIVSMKHHPVSYMIVNEWRGWLTRGLAAVEQSADNITAIDDDYETTLAATEEDHVTMGSFYGLIRRGGDDYMPLEQVANDWDKDRFPFDEAEIKLRLAELKKYASAIVKPLVHKELCNGDANDLTYLTCARVEKGDIPWANEEEGDCEDDAIMDED